MNSLTLNGTWEFRKTTDTEWLEGNVPGSLLADLHRLNLIEEPYYRDNEDKLFEIFKHDYEYRKLIKLSDEEMKHSNAVLRFEGLDTLAEVFVNGVRVGEGSNMHLTYEFDIKDYLNSGLNEIIVSFKSSTNYILAKQEQNSLYGIPMAVPGYTHLRKGHYMFGWDWGPKLPDCGIWRNASLSFYSTGRWNDIRVEQFHEADSVKLQVNMKIENTDGEGKTAIVSIISPEGDIQKLTKPIVENESVEIILDNPQLWWPNGYGEQPLYQVECLLMDGQDALIDKKSMQIGLRTLTVNTDPDQWGSKFAFCINGIEIFAMGADYIPEDNVLSWVNTNRTETLIKDCVKANFNMIRVWGGGIYPNDEFYNLCDQYGLIVWQDLMFACGVYELDDQQFVETSMLEIIDNVKRIRHHACLGLICGNNEIEMFFEDGRIESTEKNKANYKRFFEGQVPAAVTSLAPSIFYWPGSPSSGGDFFETNGENHGDGHYWDVWHGNKPFTAYRETYFRFMSEFGFESLPSMKTINSFTEKEDRNLFSYIMEKHQKNPDGNTKILTYLADNFQNPKDFPSLVYTSQILQAEAMRYGVEHWRRNRGRCMGSLYWQLNDCWPTSSWSSIDYYGRWKALHYAAKRFYAPVLLSAKENGTSIELHLTNDTRNKWEGSVSWFIMTQDGKVIENETTHLQVNELSTTCFFTKDFPVENQSRDVFFYYKIEGNSDVHSSGTVLFVPAKHFNFKDPELNLTFSENEEEYVIHVEGQSFAKYIELDTEGLDVIFSDNYFDLPAGEEYVVTINKLEFPQVESIDNLKRIIKVNSYYHSY